MKSARNKPQYPHQISLRSAEDERPPLEGPIFPLPHDPQVVDAAPTYMPLLDDQNALIRRRLKRRYEVT